MNDIPLVSIGLPAYNGAATIRDSIQSLLNQNFSNYELIICDDGSTDETGMICEEIAAENSRVVLHKNDVNQGMLQNFRAGCVIMRLPVGRTLFCVAEISDLASSRSNWIGWTEREESTSTTGFDPH